MKKVIKNNLTPRQKEFILTLCYSWRWPCDWFFCKIKGLKWHSSWRFFGLPLVQSRRPNSIKIGRRFTACSDSRHNSLGVSQKVILKTLRPQAELIIGDSVSISGATISVAKKITIGNNVLIGTGVIITDSDSHPIHFVDRETSKEAIAQEVRIGDEVFIGARAIILKGVTVGMGAVIGAGSVVTKDVSTFTVVAGNPAHWVKTL